MKQGGAMEGRKEGRESWRVEILAGISLTESVRYLPVVPVGNVTCGRCRTIVDRYATLAFSSTLKIRPLNECMT
jgi:hypothetical protein